MNGFDPSRWRDLALGGTMSKSEDASGCHFIRVDFASAAEASEAYDILIGLMGTPDATVADTFARGPWIAWAGGDRPIAEEQLIDVRWNNGAVSRCMRAGDLSGMESELCDMWASRSAGGHIVAYRIVDTAPTDTFDNLHDRDG